MSEWNEYDDDEANEGYDMEPDEGLSVLLPEESHVLMSLPPMPDFVWYAIHPVTVKRFGVAFRHIGVIPMSTGN